MRSLRPSPELVDAVANSHSLTLQQAREASILEQDSSPDADLATENARFLTFLEEKDQQLATKDQQLRKPGGFPWTLLM